MTPVMRLFALTFGSESLASSYYRVFQYRGLLREAGVMLDSAVVRHFRDFDHLRDYDIVLLQKKLVPGRYLKQIRQHSRCLIYDADDRIWLGQVRQHAWGTRVRNWLRLRAISRASDGCLAANSIIAGDIKKHRRSVEVVPMSLPSEKWPMREVSEQPFTVGWTGAPNNLPYLDELWPALERLQTRHPEWRFIIHSGGIPAGTKLRFQHLPFEPGKEGDAVRQFDVGLLPLPESPFARGKSPIKALQYLASKTPIVASPVGALKEMVEANTSALFAATTSQWEEQIEKLYLQPELRREIAHAGRRRFEQHFSQQVVFENWFRYLKNISASVPPGKNRVMFPAKCPQC